jgi:hypothetical protein
MKDKEMPPVIRVKGKDGAVYYPKFEKNAQGKWEMKDKSFQKMLSPSEIERLQQSAKDANAFFQKAFASKKNGEK